jgi:hypothetical protein
VDRDVTFTDADPAVNDRIGGVVNPDSRAATIKLVPR